MTLTTFGAIMGFAAEIVADTKRTCEALAEKAKNAALKEALQELAREEGKAHVLMETTRREHVTEMILEPIAGFHKEDYEMDANKSGQQDDAGLLSAAMALVEREKRFFHDAAAKVSLPEAARVFRKAGKKREEIMEKFKSLSL